MNSSTTLNYGINFSVNPPKFFNGLNKDIEQITANTQKMSGSFGGCWRQLLSINQALEGVRNLTALLDGAIQPGSALNASLTDLSAITGLTGKALNGIGEAARSSARIFGTDAAQNVESYKLLLSQLSPDIAKNADALKLMGDHVNTLSKTMGGNTIAATEVLTTAMNQYGVSLADPMQASKTMADMMNVMAAAAKEGSAELPQIKSALEQVGMVAKTTGVTFSETNAAIQVLDKAGKKGAEGGVALRNALSTLSEGRFLPKQTKAELEAVGVSIAQLGDKSIPLSNRLNALKPIVNDTALITKLFGKENAAAAIALVNGSEDIEEYNRKIQGTNTAVDQAKIVMGSYQEQMKRTTAFFNDLKIGFFELTQGALSYIQTGASLAVGIGQITSGITALGAVTKVLKKVISATVRAVINFSKFLKINTIHTRLLAIWQGRASLASRLFAKSIRGIRKEMLFATGATRAFSVAIASIPLLGWIAIALGAITAAIAYLWENSRRFREILFGIWEVGKLVFGKLGRMIFNIWTSVIKPVFSAIGNFATSIFTGIANVVKTVLGWIVGYYTWLWDSIKFVFTSIWEGIQAIGTGIGNFFSGLWTWFSSTFSGFAGFIDQWLVQPIAGAFSGLWTIISGVFTSIWNGLKSIFKPIVELWNKVFPDNMMQKLEGYWQKIVKTNDKGQKKGGKDFDDDKSKKKAEEGEENEGNVSVIPTIPKLQTGKGGLKGFGAKAAAAAKNTPSAADKPSGLSNSNSVGGNRSLTINKLVETLIVKVERLPKSKERIKDAVSEALLLAVNDYNLAT